MANIHRLIVLFFLSFWSFNSFALIPPSSTVYYNDSLGTYYSVDSACNAFGNSIDGYLGEFDTWMNSSSLYCYIYYYYNSANPRSKSSLAFNIKSNSCPQNSTLSGNQCICNEGYEEKNGNSCVLPEQPDLCESLAEKCETLSGSKKWITGLRRNVSYKPFKTCTPAGLVPGCNKGCVINSSGNGVFYKDQSGDYYFEGEGTISSETCFPTCCIPDDHMVAY